MVQPKFIQKLKNEKHAKKVEKEMQELADRAITFYEKKANS